MSYDLGPVKPWVKAAAYELGTGFGIKTILGVGSRPGPSDHPLGLALDFMTRNGTALAEAARSNARALGVTYVIWNQRIWSVARNSEGWRAMEDRGSDTANHKDHVHVSFTSTAPPGFDPDGSLTDPRRNPGIGPGADPGPGGIPGGRRGGTNPGGGRRGDHAGYFPGGDALDDLTTTATQLALYGAAIGLGVLLIAIGAARTARPIGRNEP